ncbi:MAG TPA: response regulator [Gemmatales bacterium]|nr:response regulator [Gemmatales bacterium]HMP59859.1 response regulator [Gemmatales bacterium]
MQAARELVPYSIVIADDNRSCRDDLRALLEPEGYKLHLAASGEDALDLLERMSIHLLLCDMQMPKLTGLETVRLAHVRDDKLPCILVTAERDEGLIRQALAERVYSVLSKPVSRAELLYTTSRALAKTYGPLSN